MKDTHHNSIKGMIAENYFTIAIVVYLILLAWSKSSVYLMYQSHGVVKTTIALLIVPFIALLAHKIKKRKKVMENSNQKFTSVKQLNENKKFMLRKYTPTAQLPLLNEALLVSLGLTFDILSSIQVNEKNENLFEYKFNRIIILLKAIGQRPEFVNNMISTRSRNNAVFIFAFYRVLFHQVIDKGIEQNILNSDIDRWVLLKRIPPKVSIYLGSQSWRLYELTTLIFGDLTTLSLNRDISDMLIALCQQELISSVSVDNNSSDTVTVVKNQEDKKKVENEGKKEEEETERNLASSSTTVKESETIKESIISDKEFINKFDRWIKRQVKRYPINQYERCFMSMTAHGKDKLFLTDICLSDFCKKDNINIDLCKKLLIENGNADSSVFYLKRNNKEDLKLLSIHIDFSVDITQLLNGKIVRCKNGSSYISEASKS